MFQQFGFFFIKVMYYHTIADGLIALNYGKRFV